MVANAKQSTTRLEDARARMYRDLIFESAECVFGARGFDGATMQEIANEAGVSLKTVYASYPGKHELFEAIMQVRGAAFLLHVREAAEKIHEGPIERLEAMTQAFVEFLFGHREWLQIHLRSRIAWSVRPSDEEAAELWRKGLEDFEKLLAEGIEQGVFYPADPKELAVLVNTIIKVQVTYAADLGEEDPEPVAERAILYLRRLLCVPGIEDLATS